MADETTNAHPSTGNGWASGNELPAAVDLFAAGTETVCEFGDVTFVASDGVACIKIKVSTCILASSSKVFKALFSKSFAEGQALGARRDEPLHIKMHDTPLALFRLCKLLHLQTDVGSLQPSELLDLATVVDKYDCAQPLRYAMDNILANVKPYSGSEGMFDCAAAAFLADQAEHFRRATKQLVLGPASIQMPTDPRLTVSPSSLIPSIQSQRHFALIELTSLITTFLERYSVAAFEAELPNYTRKLLRVLQKSGLWPLNLHSVSLQVYLECMRSVHIPTLKGDRYPDESAQGCRARRDYGGSPTPSLFARRDQAIAREQLAWGDNTPLPPPKDPEISPANPPTQQDLERINDRINEVCNGLCLDCVKGRDICRIPHATSQDVFTESDVESSVGDMQNRDLQEPVGGW